MAGVTARNIPKASPSDMANMNTSTRFSGILDDGRSSCLTTFPGSTSHRSTCLTTLPVDGSNTCVVPPAAASLGRHGRSSTQENLHDVSSSSPRSSQLVILRSMSSIMPPRLPTFCLNRSTPLNETKGSANSQSGS